MKNKLKTRKSSGVATEWRGGLRVRTPLCRKCDVLFLVTFILKLQNLCFIYRI